MAATDDPEGGLFRGRVFRQLFHGMIVEQLISDSGYNEFIAFAGFAIDLSIQQVNKLSRQADSNSFAFTGRWVPGIHLIQLNRINSVVNQLVMFN